MMTPDSLIPLRPCLQGLLIGSLLLAGCQSSGPDDSADAEAQTPPAAISYPAYDSEAPVRSDTASRDPAPEEQEQDDSENSSPGPLQEAGRTAGELTSQTGEGLTDAAKRAAGLARNLVDSLRGDTGGGESASAETD